MPKKRTEQRTDGLSAGDVEKIRKAIRQVWMWSWPRRLVIKRCLTKDGFSKCEQCGKKCPKVAVDHIERVGLVDAGFIERLFCPSSKLQGLCKDCHRLKTNEENREKRAREKITKTEDPGDFY